jgi:hypothetical membrane protein
MPDREKFLTLSALAGLTAPILFSALIVVQGFFQPSYSHVAMPISALAAWPLGWLQELNFYIFGALMIMFAAGLHRGIRRGERLSALGPTLLAVSGVGVIITGIFSWARIGDGFVEPPGHAIGSLMAFAGAGGGLASLASRMRHDDEWRDLARYAKFTGLAVVLLFFAVVVFVVTSGETGAAPSHPFLGLMQRGVVTIWLVGIFVLAYRLFGLTGSDDTPSPRP